MYRTTTSSKHIVRTVLVLALTAAFLVALASPAMAYSARHRRVIAIIKSVAAEKHLSRRQVRALLKICNRESGFNPRARNHSCKGLFQLKTHFGYAKWSNARWNTAKAIRYIKHRYGTCRRALAHSYAYGWY